MKTIATSVIFSILCLLFAASCRNPEIDPESESQITFVEISRFTANKNDVYDIPFENVHAIKLFIYRSIVRKSGGSCNVIRVMHEPEYLLFQNELSAVFPLKKIESGKRYLSGLSPQKYEGSDQSDGLDYSATYMFDNKVCCIIIESFELSGDSTTLDIPVVFFRGILDAYESIYRFKKEGNNWYFVGHFTSWIS